LFVLLFRFHFVRFVSGGIASLVGVFMDLPFGVSTTLRLPPFWPVPFAPPRSEDRLYFGIAAPRGV